MQNTHMIRNLHFLKLHWRYATNSVCRCDLMTKFAGNWRTKEFHREIRTFYRTLYKYKTKTQSLDWSIWAFGKNEMTSKYENTLGSRLSFTTSAIKLDRGKCQKRDRHLTKLKHGLN
jgi:hypothetical protein